MGHDCCGTSTKTKPTSLSALRSDEVENKFQIIGVDCNDEVVAIKKALSGIGITSLEFNLISSTVLIRHHKDIQENKIIYAIESTGVKVLIGDFNDFFAINKRRIILISIAGLSLSFGLMLSWSLKETIISNLLFTLATATSGVLVFPKAWRTLKQKSLDMNILMTVAVIGAFGIREYSEAATVVFLFSLAELLESFSVDRARKAIREVLNLTPQLAWKKQGETVFSVPAVSVSVGDLLLVKSGENIPLDGLVLDGNSSVNQAPVTGESVPVTKGAGDSVYAGTINGTGTFTMKVTKEFQDSKISRMMKLVEEAQSQRANSEKFVDRFTRIYTPLVFIMAILVTFFAPLALGQSFGPWVYRALVLLVIACPCALVLATPVSVVSGLASLARRGVLVKGGIYLETLGKLKTIAIDKTGTLTEGKFKVLHYRSFSKNESEAFQITEALERASSHPLAKAVIEFIKLKNLPVKTVDDFKYVPGRGAQGYVDSCLYFVGNHRFAHDLGVCTPELEDYLVELESQALSVAVVGHSPHAGHAGDVLGVFALGDSLRSNAKKAIEDLHKIGVKKVIILSGDNQKTVDAIKKLSGVDEGYGDLLPEDKLKKLKVLKEIDESIAMVGDGINDAPALAHASVGISMGAAGSDTAIETSDIALMQDNLEELPNAIRQGRRVLGVIKFNIAFALITKVVFLILAVLGFSSLWLAVAADMGVSILVTANALRLLRV